MQIHNAIFSIKNMFLFFTIQIQLLLDFIEQVFYNILKTNVRDVSYGYKLCC